MRVTESCAECLYDKQKHLSRDQAFLARIREIIDTRKEEDTAPYLVYLFNLVYREHFGEKASYKEIKEKYNTMVLKMENSIWEKIQKAEDPLKKSLAYARVGNYIDFGAMNRVEEEVFLELLERGEWRRDEEEVYHSFVNQCKKAEKFLLLLDNCGEIVLDKLFIRQLKAEVPQLEVTVMVRGDEVLNDATMEDALQVGLDQWCKIITNGHPVAGTVYEMLSEEGKRVMDEADVIHFRNNHLST